MSDAQDFNTEIEQEVKKFQEALAERMRQREAEANAAAEEIKKEAPSGIGGSIGIEFKVKWKDHTFILGLPSATMKEQKWVMGIPEFKMQDQAIILHLPSVRMKLVKTGQYPEFHGPFTIIWKDILISVPEPYMEENRIVLGLPTVTMKNQDIIVSLPEFSIVQNTLILKIPEFTVVSVESTKHKMKQDAEQVEATTKAAVNADLKELVGATQQVIIQKVHDKFTDQRKSFQIQKEAAIKTMDDIIQILRDAAIKLNGADPAVVASNSKSLDEAIAQRMALGISFASAEEEMDKQEKAAVDQIATQLEIRSLTVAGLSATWSRQLILTA